MTKSMSIGTKFELRASASRPQEISYSLHSRSISFGDRVVLPETTALIYSFWLPRQSGVAYTGETLKHESMVSSHLIPAVTLA